MTLDLDMTSLCNTKQLNGRLAKVEVLLRGVGTIRCVFRTRCICAVAA